MIKKTSETAPTMASVVNQTNSSTEDSYSCNYINNLHTYSTNEIRVGTWIDGKPIYRKVYEVDGAGYFGSITGIDKVTSITGMIYRGNGNHYMLGAYNGQYYSSVNIDDQTYDMFELATNLTNISKVVIIIEYTKTTN